MIKKIMLRAIANAVEEAVLIAVGPRQNKFSVGSFSTMNDARLALHGSKLLQVGAILSRIILSIKAALHASEVEVEKNEADLIHNAVRARDETATVALSEKLFTLAEAVGRLVVHGHGITKSAAEMCQNLALLHGLAGARSGNISVLKLASGLIENILHGRPPSLSYVYRVYLALSVPLLEHSSHGKALQDSPRHADILQAIEDPEKALQVDVSFATHVQALSKFTARQYHSLKR